MLSIIILFFTAVLAYFIIINYKKQAEKPSVNDDVSIDELFKSLSTETARIEAYIQAGIVGDKTTVDAINANTYDGPLPEKRGDGGWLSIYDNLRILKIAGINHRSGINRYKGRVMSVLVPEPNNKYDYNAIMVLSKDDGHHLGYIPSNMTDFVRSMAKDQFPFDCISMITEEEDETDGHYFFEGYVYIVSRE